MEKKVEMDKKMENEMEAGILCWFIGHRISKKYRTFLGAHRLRNVVCWDLHIGVPLFTETTKQ